MTCPYCDKNITNTKDHFIDSRKCFHKFELDKVRLDPLCLIEKGYLTIKTKQGRIENLILNSTQKRVLNKIKELLMSGKPVRLWTLKARQMGISTLIEAIVYVYTSVFQGVNSCVIADDLKGSNYIFEMQKLFYEKLQSYLKPKIRHSNEKKLAFRINSQILVDTAENKDAGHKYTFRMIHLSECARFPHGLETVMKGLTQTVPNEPGTMIIGETTANGFNEFYERWKDSLDGKSEWTGIFLAWHEHEEYKLPLEGGKFYPIEGIKFKSVTEKEKFLIGEETLKKRFNLSDEQINWRRFYIINYCNGEIKIFNEQYPSSPDEAFISTGDAFFDKDGLSLQEAVEPLAVVNIVKFDGKFIHREHPAGKFKVYEYPQRDDEYVIGGDSAEGLEHGDNSVWCVLNKKTNKTACIYKHKIPPDDFAQDGILLANFYNEALIAPENKGYGYGVCQDIWADYGNIYRNVKTKEGGEKQTKDLGFNTNRQTRSEMLAQLNEEIKEHSTELLDGDLIRECQTFVNIDGKAQAEKGKTDDLVIARSIAGIARRQFPYVRSVKYAKEGYGERENIPEEALVNGGFGFAS